MNKLLLSFAVASALGLAGCGGESLDEIKQDTQTGGEVQIPLSRVVYDPANGVLSPPNDLLLQGTQDGTLFMPGEKNAAGAHIDAPNYADPSTALGALDGWSTQNPFTIALNFTSGVTLDAASVQQAGSVHLVETLMGDPASPDADCRVVPRGAACKAVGSLTYGVDFITRASGNSIAVIPLKPLKAATTYILVFTDALKDSEGRSVAPSSTYELVKQDITTKPLGTAAQLALQGVINSFENAVAAESINKESIIYTAAITTQSTAPVFNSIKGLMARALNQGQLRLTVTNNNETAEQALVRAGFKDEFSPASPLNLASVYLGSITLPYYLGVPTDDNQAAPLKTSWKARCDSGAIIATLTAEKKAEYAAAMTDPAQIANDAFCNTVSLGALRDFGLDKQRHITKFNSIPVANSNETIEVQMTVPNVAFAAMIGLTLTKPDAGWPVVILQHGITSQKEAMLAITAALSARGFATVAIDHPLHGSRGFDVRLPNAEGVEVDTEINATTHSATDYMNLSNLLVTRDNLRQSIADMLGLRLGLNDPTLVGLINAQDVQFLGHSLGAISGTSMVALANTTTGTPAVDAAYQIRSAALAMPGGAVANFLLESASFGPTIKASVLLGAGGATAQAYLKYAATDSCSSGEPLPYAKCFKGFADALAISNPAGLAALNASFSSFAFAAQTLTDAGDPNNYASMLVASKTPTYMIEVIGDQGEKLPDQVIPNSSAGMPLAGTEPLAALLGASAVNNVAGTYPVAGTALSRFTAGGHSSILSPIEGTAVMTEMQTQAANFVLSRGAAVVVTDGTVMAPAN